jgi:hypothetical protein
MSATVSDDVGPTKWVAIVKTTKSNYERRRWSSASTNSTN